MKKSVVLAIVGALVAGGMVGGATMALAQADVIKARQDNRKAAAAEMRAIKGIVDAKGDVKDAKSHAAKLKELEVAFDGMFPAGSDKGETKALPTVWSDMAGFKKAGADAVAAYDKMAAATDLAALTAAFADTGKACGACHNTYRAKAN
jgi:cytochrome c556